MKLSDIIKLELMKYFRFERQFTMVCTECVHNSDVSALSNNTLIEVEVKISKSDFRREFQQTTEKSFNYWKEQKHRFYLHPEEAWNGYIIPNKFYFCVPAELASWALDYMQDKNSKYGLLAYDTERTTGNTHIVTIKGAKAMHKNTPEQKVFLQVAKRMANELITAKFEGHTEPITYRQIIWTIETLKSLKAEGEKTNGQRKNG